MEGARRSGAVGRATMWVQIRVEGVKVRAWVVVLAQALARRPGVRLSVKVTETQAPDGPELDRFLRAAARMGRGHSGRLSVQVPASALASHATPEAGDPDLILDIAGDAPRSVGVPVWRLSFDGHGREEGLLAALLRGRAPVVALMEDGHPIASGRPGTETAGNPLGAYDDALARTITLVAGAIGGARPRLPPDEERPRPLPLDLSLTALASHVARRSATIARRGAMRLTHRTPHWRVGWRRLDGPDLIDLRAHPGTGWHDLPDDGTRFYADPFPIEHGGRTVLFVEDYEHRRGKAVISALPFDRDGPVGRPVPVLDEPYHLSYPFVLEREGAVWMIPESCAAGTVDLYRASAFPGGWVKEATLLSGLSASDATLVEHNGRWWMLATVRERPFPGAAPDGSFSDALHLWSAPDFRGPWRAHPANPVLIDAASARSAGRIVARGGALIRPVQDCRGHYGRALSLARIERLDEEGYRQRVETTLEAGPSWPGICLHTLNRAGGFEFIDGSGWASRLRRGG